MIALAAIALWPIYAHSFLGRASTPAPRVAFTPAPVTRDDLTRNTVITFYERRVKNDATDQISAALLSAQYLQRYREAGDSDDVTRAIHAANLSLQIQSRGNAPGAYALAAAYLTQHRFRAALAVLAGIHAEPGAPRNMLFAKRASLYMELGEYTRAAALLARISPERGIDVAAETTLARYAQLTGDLAGAKRHLQTAQEHQDQMFDAPAEGRAWYHFRQGELAFQGGDIRGAITAEHDALAIFPHYAQAYNALARFALADGDAQTAYTAASKGAAILPLPETLGYQADAAEALGRRDEALRIRDELVAVAKLTAAAHTNDRLVAVYYSDHGMRLQEALAIARGDVQIRGNEIYTQDTLAWAAAMAGAWPEAHSAMQRAVRLQTQDALLYYHAAIIALHFYEREAARQGLERALGLNPHFHPRYAKQARELLATLRG